MSNLGQLSNPIDLLLQGLNTTRLPDRTDAGFSRLERAMQANIAQRDIAAAIRDNIATQREITVLRERERIKEEAAARKAAAEQQQAIRGILATVDARVLSQASAEEREALRGSTFELAMREAEIEELIQEQTLRADLTNPEQLQALDNLVAAQGTMVQQRRTQVSDEDFATVVGDQNFQEAFRNRNDSAYNPISFARNIGGAAIRGITGLADLGITAGSLGLLGGAGDAISDVGERFGEFVDDTSFGAAIQRERLAQRRAANPDRTFLEGISDGIDTLNAGAVSELGANLLGLLAGGGGVTAGARALGRAATARGGNAAAAAEAVTPAARLIQRGGGGALATGAGLDFSGNAVDPDGFLGNRFGQAITQLGGTAALGALGGTSALAGLVGGVEGAAARGGARAVTGGPLRARTAVPGVREGAGNFGRNLLADGADRVVAGTSSAARQGLSEANQELLEGLVSQGAESVGTGQNQFNAGDLGEQFGTGGVIGGGLGAGRAVSFRPRSPAATPEQGATPGPAPVNPGPTVTLPPGDAAPPVTLPPAVPPQQPFPPNAGPQRPELQDPQGFSPIRQFGPLAPGVRPEPVQGPPAPAPAVQINTDPDGSSSVQVQPTPPTPPAPAPAFFQDSPQFQAQQDLRNETDRFRQLGSINQGNVAEPTVFDQILPESEFLAQAPGSPPPAQPGQPVQGPAAPPRSLAALRRLTGQQVNNLGNEAVRQSVPELRGVTLTDTSAEQALSPRPTPTEGQSAPPAEDLSTIPAPRVSLTPRETEYVNALATGPQSREALQSALGLSGRGPVSRMANILRSKGVIDETAQGELALTDTGTTLVSQPSGDQVVDEPVQSTRVAQPQNPLSGGLLPPDSTPPSGDRQQVSNDIPANPPPAVSATDPNSDTAPGQNAELQQAFSAGRIPTGRAIAAEAVAAGRMTPDEAVAEYEQLAPNATDQQADALFDYLTRVQEGQAEAPRLDISEQGLDNLLQRGNLRDANRVARELFDNGTLTQQELIDTAGADGISDNIRQAFGAAVQGFTPQETQPAAAGANVAQLAQELRDAEARLELLTTEPTTEAAFRTAEQRVADARDRLIAAGGTPDSAVDLEEDAFIDEEGIPEGDSLGEPVAAASRPSPSPSADVGSAPSSTADASIPDDAVLSGPRLEDVAGLSIDDQSSPYTPEQLGGNPYPKMSRRTASSTDQFGDSDSNRPPMRTLAIRTLVAEKAGSFNVNVIEDPNQLTTEFREVLLRDTGYEWDNNVEAVIYGDTIYINQPAIKDRTQLEAVLAHEILGHAGLRERHGPQLGEFLTEVIDDAGGLEKLLEIADRLGLNTRADYNQLINRANGQLGIGRDAQAVAEEVIVGLVEADGLSAPQLDIVNRMGAAIRRWLRRSFPRLAKYTGADVLADWELTQYARDASRSGRRLLDQGRQPNIPRAYASRNDSWYRRLYAAADQQTQAARDYASNVIRSEAPPEQMFAGLADNVRHSLSDIRRNPENRYNKFFRRHINNLRPLQLASLKQRTQYLQLNQDQQTSLAGKTTTLGVDSGKLRHQKNADERAKARDLGVLRHALNVRFDRDASDETKAYVLQDKVDIYAKKKMSNAQAELAHITATKSLDGDLRSHLSVLAQASERYSSQADAYELADKFIGTVHGMERNEAFFWDITHSGSKWKKWVGEDVVEQVKAIRQRTHSKGTDALGPRAAFIQERRLLANALRDADGATQAEAQAYRLDELMTTGPNTSTRQMREQLRKMDLNTGEKQALAALRNTLQEYVKLNEQVRQSWQGDNKGYTDQIERYNWNYYSPQWTRDKDKENDHMIGEGVHDPMVSRFDKARGQTKETTSPIASIITQVNRTYHDASDNDVNGDVLLLWSLAQDPEGAAAIGEEYADASVEVIDKRSKAYRKMMRRPPANWFIHHLSDQTAGLINASSRDQYNQNLSASPSNYVVVLKYKKNSPVPERIKGKKERSKIAEQLRTSDNFAAGFLSGAARTIGFTHTKWDPEFYLVNLLRETVASFSTVGALTGAGGLRDFGSESAAAAAAIMPKIGQWLYYQGTPGREAAAKLAALEEDVDLKQFIEFYNSGSPTQLAQSMSLNTRIDDFANNLRARGFTPDANMKFQDVDRILATLPAVTDTVGRFAAYKTFLKQGMTPQRAAFESRDIADFSQVGESATSDLMSMGYMFFRSSMVGAGKWADLFLDSEYNLEMTGGAMAIATAMFAAAWGLSGEDDEGNNLFLTQGNSVHRFRIFLGDDAVVQIPYSYNTFTSIGAATVQALYALTGNQSFGDAAANTLDIATTNLSPFGNNIPITDEQGNFTIPQAVKKFGMMAVPTLFEPSAMLGFNINNFGSRITPDVGGRGDPGSEGRPFNSSRSQFGGLAEAFSRGAFDALGVAPDVRKVDFALDNYFNGPTAAAETLMEWYRIATGSAGPVDVRRAAGPLAGAIGRGNDTRVQRYYEMVDRASDIERSLRSLQRSGMTEQEANEYMRQTIGEETLRQVETFENLNGRARDISSQLGNIRYSTYLTLDNRRTQYDRLYDEWTSEISGILSEVNFTQR